MWKYLVKRFLLMFPTLLGVALLTFVLIRVIPGDVVELRYAGDRGSVSQDVLEKERARFGLDQPLWRQFATWVLGVARLDFGESMWTGAPIWQEIRLRFALSLQVAIMATLVAVVLAIPLGVLAALKQDSWIDYAVRIFSIAGLATPSFWLGIVFILLLLVVFHWLPPMIYTPFWVSPWENLKQLIWPALAVGYRYSAVATRMTRSAMLEVLREDYIRTARAKGLVQRLILARHALKNAMLPVLTVVALEFAFLIGGLVVTEQVFNLNGLGLLFVQAVAHRDYTLIQALVMLVAGVFIVVKFAVALLAPVLSSYDPEAVDFGAMLARPSLAHWLGTDSFGRDVLSRLIFGSRTALMVGFGASVLGATLGAILGVGSAYFGGRVDLYLQRVMDVFLSFPLIVLALALVAILGNSIPNLIMAIMVPMIPRSALVIRSSALAIREMPFVDAARAAGFGHARIVLRHMLPNVMAPYLIILTAFLGQAILAEASLSFLGLGVQEPTAAWGLMLRGAAVEFAETAPWMAIFPGLAISLSVFAFNLFGDSLRDALDPRLRTQ